MGSYKGSTSTAKTGRNVYTSMLTGNYQKSNQTPVAGYSVWLDASDLSTITYSNTSNTTVSQWTDKSGSAFAFTQATTSRQPVRNRTLNGLPILVYDGDDDFLKSTASASTWNYLHNGDTATLFVVARSVKFNPAAGGGVLVTGYCSENTGFALDYTNDKVYASTTRGVSGSSAGSANVDDPRRDYQWNVISVYLDQDNATASQRHRIYKNFGSVNTSSGENGAASNNNATLSLNLGYEGACGPYYFGGEIAEIIIYSSILSDSDRIENIKYLNAKWKLGAGSV